MSKLSEVKEQLRVLVEEELKVYHHIEQTFSFAFKSQPQPVWIGVTKIFVRDWLMTRVHSDEDCGGWQETCCRSSITQYCHRHFNNLFLHTFGLNLKGRYRQVLPTFVW